MALGSAIRSALGAAVSGGVGGSAPSLLDQATDYLGGIAPHHWWDFINNRALYAGANVGGVANTPSWSFARASIGTYTNADGSITTFASGQLRRGNRGVLIEGARTNLFLNSAIGATQGATVAAAAHTLSFYGTGTITLTGVSTAGPLVGTGANNRVTLTFTPTAGTLTLTIAGSCTNVQLEAGAFATSYIPTEGTSVTREADVLTIANHGVAYPLTLWGEWERIVDTAATESLIQLDTVAGGNNERVRLLVTAADVAQAQMVDGGVSQAGVVSVATIPVGSTPKVAARFSLNSVNLALNGTASTQDTAATLPDSSDRILVGAANGGTGQQIFGYIHRLAIFNSALSDADLQTITS